MHSILIVDDEARIRDVYQKMFEKEGFQVFAASNAPDAKDLLLQQSIDIVLLDINMDEVNGRELYEVIRSFHRDVNIIVSSVYPIDEQKEMIPEAQDYFDKSEGVKALIKKVRKVLLVEKFR
jgi:CheY-like chemotaxis protein